MSTCLTHHGVTYLFRATAFRELLGHLVLSLLLVVLAFGVLQLAVDSLQLILVLIHLRLVHV